MRIVKVNNVSEQIRRHLDNHPANGLWIEEALRMLLEDVLERRTRRMR